MLLKHRLLSAIKAASVHLLCSICVAMLAGVLVFGVWYPFPYRELMGGRELFLLVTAVDVVCGPLLTLVLYNPAKPRSELLRDLGLVALIQLAALLYGLHTVMVARPVHLVFETDRFNAVSAIDIDEASLAKAPPPWNTLPFWGPTIISTREAKDGDERLKSLDMSMQGVEPSMRPDWWQAIEASKAQILARAKPLADLRKRHAGKPDALQKIDLAVKDSGKAENHLIWLPLTSNRNKDWTVLLNAQTGMPLAYAAVGGF
jgi:hypothetical protein